MKGSYGDSGPIAAQAAGFGALALIRTGGAGSLERLAEVFSRPAALLEAPGHSVVHGWILEGASRRRIDEALVSVYRAPRSYTGEDGADISCHGGAAAVKAVLETLRGAGFRDALPGEFTFRAFMNGKIDLTRSESVMELVSAKTGKALEQAVKRLSGALEKEIGAIRELLVDALSEAERSLDYPDDELDETPPALPGRGAAEGALGRLRDLLGAFRRERLYREGALGVIAGRPNAGKSSLFNALLNEDRSIVAELPGTTRDWIEGSVSVEGIPLRLADTAGLREFTKENEGEGGIEGEGAGIESQGIRRSKTLIGEADIVFYTVDGGEGLNGEDEELIRNHRGPLVLVWNKNDLRPAPAEMEKRLREQSPDRRFAALSAKNGTGLEGLCAAAAALLGGGADSSGENRTFDAGLGTVRQKELAERAVSALEEALDLADREEPLDIIAPLIREALDALGEITGEVSSADILEKMFSRFCLGK
ncbi:MAG: tRNA uridine-5-carboxymethylaminomethyl(34) synthesis GTPase MnmE [Treponema sp.]|jgi:tRNA modification GTPase|nr:tRNA uridine-5-carboxymethylaminomethyl(34) synthesis GTPase MnmE [Treponema sp.]